MHLPIDFTFVAGLFEKGIIPRVLAFLPTSPTDGYSIADNNICVNVCITVTLVFELQRLLQFEYRNFDIRVLINA